MGLKNISLDDLVVKYNGIEIKLAPEAIVDTRDFNIGNAEVMYVEENLCDKYISSDGKRTRQLERVKTLSNMNNAEINEEIAHLREQVETMKADVAPREVEITNMGVQIAEQLANLKTAQERIEQLEALLDEADPKWRKSKKNA